MRKLFKKINEEKLTAEEKRQGFVALQSFMFANKPKDIKSPFYSKTFPIFFRQKTFAISFTILLIFVISTSIVFASQNSLPGDVLYPVKLLNEGVESATALNTKSQAEVQVKHTITRLAEAEKLASIGNLSNNLVTEIDKQFQTHADQTIKDIAALKDGGALIDAAQVSSSFESSLANHQETINQLSSNTTTKKQFKNGLSNIATTIQNQIAITSKIQDSLDSSIASSSNKVAAKKYAENRLQSSQEKISALEQHVAESSLVNQNTNAEVKTNINKVKNLINQSQQKINDGSLNDAFKLLKQADQTTEKAAEIHDSLISSSTSQNIDQTAPTQTSQIQNKTVSNNIRTDTKDQNGTSSRFEAERGND